VADLVIATIRPALPADAASLTAIKTEALNAGVQLVESTHLGVVYVAEVDTRAVGFLALQREGHSAIAAQHPLKLWQLYVMPAFHGRGVAAQLMSAAIEHARKHQNDVIWLGVSEENARGIAFYLKHGFAAAGVHPVGAGEHTHNDIIMSRAVL
jgi:ribosomal protein S18 acetylase RimI-like enzyme